MASASPQRSLVARARDDATWFRPRLDSISPTIRSSPSVATTCIPSRAATTAQRPMPAPTSTACTSCQDERWSSEEGIIRESHSASTRASSHSAKPVSAVAPVSSRGGPPASDRPPPTECRKLTSPIGGANANLISRNVEAAVSRRSTRIRAFSNDPNNLEHSCALNELMIGVAARPMAVMQRLSTRPRVSKAHAALERSRELKAICETRSAVGIPALVSKRFDISRLTAAANPTTSGSDTTHLRASLQHEASFATAQSRFVKRRGASCWRLQASP
eukprot:scaffold10150_cov28-Tisochrysis_lutea.AAC.2